MSKNFEKKVETKEIEKKLEIKEFKEKPEKREIKEFKEKPEKREIKEIKDKPERKELIKEKIEVKEVKEIEKPVFEKGDKELVETFDPGGEVFQPRAAADAFTDPGSVAKPKEKELEKIKPEKEGIEKIKPEKEFVEKIKPEKEAKIEKYEHKEYIKEIKNEIEKNFQKELVPEKPPQVETGKPLADTQVFPGPEIDPAKRGKLFSGSGTADERLARLEEMVTKLTHFIGVDLRPDLSSGALKNEGDVDTGYQGTDAGADDKSKKK